MRLGVRAHDFGKLPVEVLSERISGKNLQCIQLALTKAIEGMEQIDGKICPGMAYQIGQEFSRRNIQIAVLGCYINPVHPDIEERNKQINRFKEHIRYARDFGCSIVATETGSFNADFSFNPQNHSEEAFQTLVKSVGELVEEAEKFGVFVGIEGVTSYVINTPARMKRLIDTIDSNNLQVVFDPVNFISPENYKSQKDILEESFTLFGDRIAAVHIKDFIMENGKKISAPVGKGLLDYTLLLKLLKSQKPYINILIEEAIVDLIDENREFLQKVWERV